MPKVVQVATIQILKKSWDDESKGFKVKPCYYRVSGLPIPNHLSCASNSAIVGEVKETSIHVTLPKLVKQTFFKDPTDNAEWWGEVRKRFKGTRTKDREGALVMLGMSLKEAIEPEKIKFNCWEVIRMKIVMRITAWGPMWLWNHYYSLTDVKAIAMNSSRRDELWNPAKDGLVAEDITPKDGSKPELVVYEQTLTEQVATNVTEVQRLYEENLERNRKRKEAEAAKLTAEIDNLPVAVLQMNLDGTPLTEAQSKVLAGERVFRPGERKREWSRTNEADKAMQLQAQDVAERHGISLSNVEIDRIILASFNKA